MGFHLRKRKRQRNTRERERAKKINSSKNIQLTPPRQQQQKHWESERKSPRIKVRFSKSNSILNANARDLEAERFLHRHSPQNIILNSCISKFLKIEEKSVCVRRIVKNSTKSNKLQAEKNRTRNSNENLIHCEQILLKCDVLSHATISADKKSKRRKRMQYKNRSSAFVWRV